MNCHLGYTLLIILFKMFVLDIFLKFNTAYYSDGFLETKRMKIFYNYVKGDLLQDLFVVVPFMLSRFNVPYTEFVLLLRVTKLSANFENAISMTSVRERHSAIIDMAKLIFINIFVSHFCSCIWHFIGDFQLKNYPSENIWLMRHGL